jgi:hypothetical protein
VARTKLSTELKRRAPRLSLVESMIVRRKIPDGSGILDTKLSPPLTL